MTNSETARRIIRRAVLICYGGAMGKTRDDEFLKAIRSNPSDETLRLVYIDWLEEKGDSRAEYLRLDMERGKCAGNSSKQAKIKRRMETLRKRLNPDWLAVVGLPRMPKLEVLGPPADPLAENEAFQSEYEDAVHDFESPDKRWLLRFHSPFEWHMGAEGWELSILENGIDVSDRHQKLVTLGGGKGFFPPHDLQPWHSAGDTIVALTWNGAYLYGISSRRTRTLPARPRDLLSIAQWSSKVDRLLLAYRSQGILIDSNMKQAGVAEWRLAVDESPNVFWLNSGETFAFVGRSSSRTKTTIRFFSDDAEPLGSQPLDPRDLLPYDEAQYAEIRRGHYSLVLSSATTAVGSLLDVWESVRFDCATNTLLLGTYRPVGKPFRRDGMLMCQAREQWAAVRIVE